MKQKRGIREWMAVAFFLFSTGLMMLPQSVWAAPVVSITPQIQKIAVGEAGNIWWTISGATRCTASDNAGALSDWSPVSGGPLAVSPKTTTTYYLECWDANNVSSGKVQSIVQVGLALTFRGSPTTITAGQSATLSWNASGNPAGTNIFCPIGDDAGNGLGWKGESGNLSVSPTVTTTYAMTCYSESGGLPVGINSATQRVTITVNPEAVCSGTVVWLSGCGGTVATPVTSGSSTTVTNTNAGFSGSASFICNSGTFSEATDATCRRNVSEGPLVLLKANGVTDALSLDKSGPVTLSWKATGGVTSCVTSGAWGSETLSSIEGSRMHQVVATSTFNIECFGARGVSTGIKSVTVTIGDSSGGGESVVNGRCAPTHNNCLAGTSSTPQSDTTYWYWNCEGTGGGKREVCNELKGTGGGSCTPDASCAATTCVGRVCSDGCGGAVNGTKSCPQLPKVKVLVSPAILPAGGGTVTVSWTTQNTSTLLGFCYTDGWVASNATNGMYVGFSGSSTETVLDTKHFSVTCPDKNGSVYSDQTVVVVGDHAPTTTSSCFNDGGTCRSAASGCSGGEQEITTLNCPTGNPRDLCCTAISTLSQCTNVFGLCVSGSCGAGQVNAGSCGSGQTCCKSDDFLSSGPQSQCVAPGSTCQSGTFCTNGASKVGSCNSGLGSCCLTSGTRSDGASVNSGSVASSSLVPCGRSIDDSNTTEVETDPCTICHIVVGSNRLITWGRNIMSIIAVTVIVAMGILYIVSAGNEGLMKTAKSGMMAALIGFAIMLTAWLIVNVVLTVLVDMGSPDKPFLGLMQDGRFYFFCDTSSNVNR